ncbi:MAG: glycosyltransferase family 4 protein [Pseudomonadota bacterium]
MPDLSPVVFALPGKLTDVTGGTRYDRQLCDALRDLGHRVEVLELAGTFPEPKQCEIDKAIERLASVPRDSVLIVDGLALGALPSDGLRGVSAPVVAMLHHPLGLETGLRPERQQALIESERAALACAARVLVPSPHVARTTEALFGVPHSRITVARPGVMQRSADRGNGVGKPADPPLILSVGLLHPRKGHDILLAALSGLTDLRWQAKIIGRAHDPDEALRLQRMITQLRLSERVTLAGQVPECELLDDYERASIFALATRYEGYGLVFDEALLHGLPIVSCHVGAVPDTVPETAGYLVPPDDAKALAAALHRVLSDPFEHARLAKSARDAGRALPGWTETAQSVSAVLNQLHLGS